MIIKSEFFYQILNLTVFENRFFIFNTQLHLYLLLLVLTNKWHLSPLLFKGLSLNHSNEALDPCSGDVIKSSKLLATMYKVI